MTPNFVSKDIPLTPFVIGGLVHPTTLTLTANFGQRPFRSLTDSVIQCIVEVQNDFERTPERSPRKWSRYPALPSVSYEERDCVVKSEGLFRTRLYYLDLNVHATFTGSSEAVDQSDLWDPNGARNGRVFRSNLPMPPSYDFFYFEIELVAIHGDGYVIITVCSL